jgi:hypothetical protein
MYIILNASQWYNEDLEMGNFGPLGDVITKCSNSFNPVVEGYFTQSNFKKNNILGSIW